MDQHSHKQRTLSFYLLETNRNKYYHALIAANKNASRILAVESEGKGIFENK
jgi:hypothetical protein